MHEPEVVYNNDVCYRGNEAHIVFGYQKLFNAKMTVQELTVISDNDQLEIDMGATLYVKSINSISLVASTKYSKAVRSLLQSDYDIKPRHFNGYFVITGPFVIDGEFINALQSIKKGKYALLSCCCIKNTARSDLKDPLTMHLSPSF